MLDPDRSPIVSFHEQKHGCSNEGEVDSPFRLVPQTSPEPASLGYPVFALYRLFKSLVLFADSEKA
jgi:hypothetical protein